MNFKFHRNCENAGKNFMRKISFWSILWNLKFFLLGSHKKSSLVLLQITNYICSSWKKVKWLYYALTYSGTRFLSTENKNFSIPWCILSCNITHHVWSGMTISSTTCTDQIHVPSAWGNIDWLIGQCTWHLIGKNSAASQNKVVERRKMQDTNLSCS